MYRAVLFRLRCVHLSHVLASIVPKVHIEILVVTNCLEIEYPKNRMICHVSTFFPPRLITCIRDVPEFHMVNKDSGCLLLVYSSGIVKPVECKLLTQREKNPSSLLCLIDSFYFFLALQPLHQSRKPGSNANQNMCQNWMSMTPASILGLRLTIWIHVDPFTSNSLIFEDDVPHFYSKKKNPRSLSVVVSLGTKPQKSKARLLTC